MNKIINRVLAVIFLLTIFVIGGVTLAQNYRSIAYAGLVTYTQYAEPGARGLATLKPRITAVENTINTKLLGKDAFQKINARMQMALGKQVLNFGGTTMVRLKSGDLYDVQSDVGEKSLNADVETMAKLKGKLDEKGIPMVYVYAHSGLYEEGLLPGGIKDYNNQVADRIVNGLRAQGITTLDSREIYRQRGMTLDQAVMRTDQHWTILMAFEAFSASVEALNATGKISLDEAAADIANYSVRQLPGAHMGDVGARVGEAAVRPDDFYMITPKFATHIERTEGGVVTTGTFEEAVMDMSVLEGGAARSIYDLYGDHVDLTYYTNENAPAGRLLIVKDSFGTPTASFMSLAAREVCAIDLRRTQRTVEEMVEAFAPDAVLVVHCQEMMRGKNYVFVE